MTVILSRMFLNSSMMNKENVESLWCGRFEIIPWNPGWEPVL